MLYWMGNDYVETLVSALRDGLLKQDPGTRLISVHCAGEPEFETAFKPKGGSETTDVATRMNVTFPVEAVVVDTAQRQWRLFLRAEYHATGLDVPASSQVKADFNLSRAEPV